MNYLRFFPDLPKIGQITPQSLKLNNDQKHAEIYKQYDLHMSINPSGAEICLLK